MANLYVLKPETFAAIQLTEDKFREVINFTKGIGTIDSKGNYTVEFDSHPNDKDLNKPLCLTQYNWVVWIRNSHYEIYNPQQFVLTFKKEQ